MPVVTRARTWIDRHIHPGGLAPFDRVGYTGDIIGILIVTMGFYNADVAWTMESETQAQAVQIRAGRSFCIDPRLRGMQP